MICELKPSMAVELQMGSKVKRRILAVGVELEGGWVDPDGRLSIDRDGSVQIDARWTAEDEVRYQTSTGEERDRLRRKRLEAGRMRVGELQSQQMPPNHVHEWIMTHHPTQVNQTCGLHVHMSFKDPSHYNRLVTPSYPATVLKYLAEWGERMKVPSAHPLWNRLAGRSEYCRAVYCDTEQIHRKRKDFDHHSKDSRYTVIAYHWSRLGTVECRVLPMFEDPEQSANAVEEVIKITHHFLASSKSRPSVAIKVRQNGEVDIQVRGAEHVRDRR